MLTRSRSVSVASSLQEMPGATSFHSGSAQSLRCRQHGSPPVSAATRCARRVPQRRRWAQHVGRPGDEGVDDRPKRLHLVPAFRARRDVRLDGGHVVRRKRLHGVQEHAVPSDLVRACSPSSSPPPFRCQQPAAACPVRNARGSSRSPRADRAAPRPRRTSTPKSTRSRSTWRSSGMRTIKALRRTRPCSRTSNASCGIASARRRGRGRTVRMPGRRASSAARSATGRSLWTAPGS